MIEWQTIIMSLISIGVSAMGYFLKTLSKDVRDAQKDLSDFKENIALNYVPKNDFKELATEIRQMFHTISDKLDRKADK